MTIKSTDLPLLVDCRDLKAVEKMGWDAEIPNMYHSEKHSFCHQNWGFIIYPGSETQESRQNRMIPFYIGAIGPIHKKSINEPCFGIPLVRTADPKIALFQFMLASGLSILEKAELELGDTLVIAGINPLAISVIAAGQAHGVARILALVPSFEIRSNNRKEVENACDLILEFGYSPSFDSQFDAFLTSCIGKVTFIDTTGDADLVYSMAIRLSKFEKLVFCRQDSSSNISMNIRNIHHINSAQFVYWSRAETVEDVAMWRKYVLRADRLINYKRSITPLSNLLSLSIKTSISS